MKTFRQILLTGLWIILLTTLGITGVSQNISVSGTIQENTVWAADTVNIVGDITVIKGVTLEIAAGTYIRAQGYYKINVAGTVNAIGTSENTIVFSVADTTGFISENNSYSGGWGGFHFCGEPENYGDASTLKYCRLEYGKCIDNPDGDYCGAAVYADYYRNLHVSNCTFENNRITKQATGDDQVFGAAIGCKNVDAIVIEESNFLHNTSFHRGGGVGIKGIVGYLLIDENEFIHNTARCYYEAGYSDSKMGSAIFCSDYAETSTCIPIVTRNSCFANDGTSTVCLACEHATVCNNLICNNDGEGVNIFHGKSYANVFNNTIAKNWEPINLGGWANGIVLGMSEYEFYSYHGAVFNNLSFRNYTDSALFIGDFFKEIYMASGTDSVDYFGNNCVTDLPSCTAGENGIYTSDAQFVNPTLGNGKNYYDPDADWSLMSESPCRDAGIILDNIDMPDVDFLGYERIVGTIDIGAIEYQVGPTYPTANFKADRVNINENAVVNFTDLSVNNPTSWEWTFEGGTPATSNQQNPSVTYNTAGVYDVSLTITNEFGSDYMIKEEYITVYLPYYPIAEFTADNVNVKENSVVNFTDLSVNNPTSWEWTFEGGTPATSNQQNPSVTYNTAGTYNVSLTITNQFGSDYRMKQDYITVYVPYYPVSDFTADKVNVYQNEVVNFTDLSTNNPTSWLWRFVGGTPAISHEQNPTTTYETPGTFDVSLTVTNEFGSDYVIKQDYITVYLPNYPIADFTADNVNINANALINFTDLSTNPVSWEWTFDGGEPATSTEQHPSVIYNTAGSFDVSLTVTNEFGSDYVIKEDYITVFLSVKDYEDKTLEIFPIPAQDVINLKSNSLIDKVEIYNLNSKLINTVDCDGNSGNVDVSQLSNGTYILKVYQRAAVKTAKVVVKK